MKGSTLKGHLDLLVLAVLAEEPLHGYAVIERLKQRSDEAFDLPEGTVYPVLHRLEKSGVLTSERRHVQGRERRIYRLTEHGHRTLLAERSSWDAFARAVGSVLGGVPWPQTT
jgi:PadR family transcriptional regulator